jgi:mono/diheme cytochrome c family protein
LFSSAVLAQNGKALHDAACLECHASLGGGDPYQLYQRDDRKVRSLQDLESRLQHCMRAADVSWDRDQQKAVVNYLNSRFYRF